MKHLPSSFKRIAAGFTCLMFALLLFPDESKAQQLSPGDIDLDIFALPALSDTQTLSIQRLLTGSVADETRLFNMTIENLQADMAGDLFLSVLVSASGRGLLVEVDQREAFSLQAGQAVVGNNTSFSRGIPGVPETMDFRRELTRQGEIFLNELRGSTRLPDLIYTFTIQIFQDGPRGEGRLIAEASTSVPVEGMSDDLDIYLLQPGTHTGDEPQTVVSMYPVFTWEGSPRNLYRIIVVEEVEGQTPETLLQTALGSNPVLRQNITPGRTLPLETDGNLLEFEILDALVGGTYFNYPASGGARRLQPGTVYYWQVFHLIRTPDGTESRPSQIFHFKTGDSLAAEAVSDDELMTLLASFIEPEELDRLQRAGFSLASLSVDGEPLTGPAIRDALEELLRQIEDQQLTPEED